MVDYFLIISLISVILIIAAVPFLKILLMIVSFVIERTKAQSRIEVAC